MPDTHLTGDMTVAIFNEGANLIFVRLELEANESAPAEAAARGYRYAGSVTVSDGVPRVQIEPGFAGAMIHAGEVLAGLLGPQLAQDLAAQKLGA